MRRARSHAIQLLGPSKKGRKEIRPSQTTYCRIGLSASTIWIAMPNRMLLVRVITWAALRAMDLEPILVGTLPI